MAGTVLAANPFVVRSHRSVEAVLLPLAQCCKGRKCWIWTEMNLLKLTGRTGPALLAGACVFAAIPAAAQDGPAAAQGATQDGNTLEDTDTGQSDADEVQVPPAISSASQTFEPAYFERFAPRNALDMVSQIPGFSIQGGGGNDGGRGLGQANENVLINGERIASKSDSAQNQLGRVPADKVVRIEILDGTALDIPGLTGQVANIVVNKSGLSGQFQWEGAIRTTEVDPEWYGGEISVSGSTGALDFTIALQNNNNRFGATGPIIIRDGAGNLIEETTQVFTGAFDVPRISGNFGYDFGADVVANLNVSWERSYFNRRLGETRRIVGGVDDFRENLRSGGTPEYEISGDISFPLGSGTLKLIGLESYDAELSDNIIIDTPADGSLPTGSRFTRSGGDGERIGRFEYGWAMLGGEWQLAGEAAFNRLERISGLFELAPDGTFSEIDFPEGTGGVTEDRYEASLSYSRSLTSKLALQATLAAEYSKIQQTGVAANSRSFQRPKGSLSLAWKPQDDLDISLEVLRQVGQLSFGDFLARVSLDDGNDDAGNNELVPDQSWGINLEINKALGALGSTTLSVEQRWIEDYIDVIPLANGGESRGNIPSAKTTSLDWNTTLRLDTLGLSGAQLDLEVELFSSAVRDPLTGLNREVSNANDRELAFDFRHDIPRSNFAYGAGLRYNHREPSFRLSEVRRDFEGPTFANVFVEHKDIFGLTVRAIYANILGGRERTIRTVFDGPRTDGQIAFIEDRNLRIGPIFRFSVSGNF